MLCPEERQPDRQSVVTKFVQHRGLHGGSFQTLVMPTFYGPPVMLEACDVEELLGCHVAVHDRRVTFDIP